MIAGDPPERRAHGTARPGRGSVRAALADEEQDEDGHGDGRQTESDRRASPADREDQRRSDHRDDDGPDISASDVCADREPASFGRELLGQQAVADRMLRRPADARGDVRDGECGERRRERLSHEPAAEQQATEAEQPPP